jgi:hypothetical protein
MAAGSNSHVLNTGIIGTSLCDATDGEEEDEDEDEEDDEGKTPSFAQARHVYTRLQAHTAFSSSDVAIEAEGETTGDTAGEEHAAEDDVEEASEDGWEASEDGWEASEDGWDSCRK